MKYKADPGKNPGIIENILKEYDGEIIDCIEGVLLDSVLIFSSVGYIAIFDTFYTTNSSIYTVYIQDDAETETKILNMWEDRKQ